MSRSTTPRVSLATLVVLLLSLLASPARLVAQCSDLVWSDELDGPSIDLSKWQFEVNGQGGGNNELQYYTDRPENAGIVGGVLRITGREETYTGPDGTRQYTSARLRTLNQGDWTYGRIEASIKLPFGQGMWPAFWMLPTDNVYGGWPQSGEIDIMEFVGFEPDVTHGTIHYGDPWPNNSNSGGSTAVPGASASFHTYAIEWEQNEIRWYVDGVHFLTRTPADVIPHPWRFDQRFHIILNLAIGGNWPGPPDATTVFPQVYEIDWVRVYQGIDSFGITGDDAVYAGDAGKVYAMADVPGATYSWSVPPGATITGGQGTHSITVDWGASSGSVAVDFAIACGSRVYQLPVTVQAPLTVDHVFENFSSERNVTYNLAITGGTLSESVGNPAPDAVNSSGSVGRYVRNAAEQYDVLFMNSANVGDASDFRFRRRVLFMDVHTDAPVGTKVTVQLEDADVSNNNPYPAGRHSGYDAFTTVQNGWQTLELEWTASPDAGTSDTAVDQIAVLFNSESFTGHTYHFDNFVSTLVPEPSYQDNTVYESYDGTSAFTVGYFDGTYSAPVGNPAPNAVNSSANAASYTRDAATQWDTLFFDTGAITATEFEAGTQVFALDLYTSAPVGTQVTWQLEDSSRTTPSNFPTGRRSSYAGVVGAQNEWHTVRFALNNVLDPATSPTAIDTVVLLFDGGNFTAHTFVIDNLRSQDVIPGGEPDPVLTTITVSPDPGSVEEGQTLQFSADCRDQLGDPIGCNVGWSVTGGGSINGAGLYSATTEGSYTVTAADGGVSDGATVDVSAAPTGTTLLSQGQPVFSSSNENAGLGPANAVDGNGGTRWSSAFTDNEWIYVDLGATHTVSRVVLDWEAAFGEQYQLQVSTNASSWTTVHTENNSDGGVDDVTFAGTSARYVRMLGITRALPYGYSLWELEVYGGGGGGPASNVAEGKPSASSSNENGAFTPDNAFDGDPGTRWSSQFSDPQWISVDLQAVYDISSVTLIWETAASASYQIQVSNNGTSWTTVHTEGAGNGGTDDVPLATSGRYVRMYSTARTTPWGNSLFEFEVYGTP